jgi:hypothetical protein
LKPSKIAEFFEFSIIDLANIFNNKKKGGGALTFPSQMLKTLLLQANRNVPTLRL